MATAPTTPEPPMTSRESGLVFVGAMAGVMWIEEIVDRVADANFDRFGIRPRSADGLDGIVTAPFLHAGFDHLISNTVPFLVMGATIALAGLARIAAVTAIVMLVGGLGTWLVASSNSVHIGASGVVFGYAAYLVSRGLYSRNLLHLAVGAIVVLVWGTALLSGLLPEPGISWQGHLFGALGGVVAAWVLDRAATRQGSRST